jgi:bifunctional UDP-N-acetylglucosamine pyrophosphorylase/glucosamine-1-phosphate N-acetyltransferase
MQEGLVAVVLAAGKGTRMKSERTKLLHEVLGRPLVAWPIGAALEAGVERVVAVVGHQAAEVEATARASHPDARLAFALQDPPQGTGHAVLCARAAIGDARTVLIVSGDVPGLRAETLRRMLDTFEASGRTLAVLTFDKADPTWYGRIVREAGTNRVLRIVEERDATPAERAIREVNAGVYVADAAFLLDALERCGTDNDQGEIYLTDAVHLAAERGATVGTVLVEEGLDVWGINDRVDLAKVHEALQLRTNQEHMRAGVTLLAPTETTIEAGVTIGRDTVIHRGARIGGGTTIGAGCLIEEGAIITASRLADGVHVKPYCVVSESELGPRVEVGPFAHLRPGTRLDEKVKVGNFVETKKAHLGKGTKASHLSYLGDAEIGPGCNIGAGTITCNYDGEKKHLTTLGAGVFIGSDTQLVAPVTLGEGAYVGAGTTVTVDVPAGALAISRAPQRNIQGWVERKKGTKSGSGH